MAISFDVIDQTNASDNHDEKPAVWIAREAKRMGFPVAGQVKDLYEDAVVLIPPFFKTDWTPKKVVIGRVLTILGDRRSAFPLGFVVLTNEGVQVTLTYGVGYPVYFALPENTREVLSGGKKSLRDEIVAKHNNGVSESSIAKELQIPVSTVRAYKQLYRDNNRLELRTQVFEKLNQGCSVAEIAKQLGIHETSVREFRTGVDK